MQRFNPSEPEALKSPFLLKVLAGGQAPNAHERLPPSDSRMNAGDPDSDNTTSTLPSSNDVHFMQQQRQQQQHHAPNDSQFKLVSLYRPPPCAHSDMSHSSYARSQTVAIGFEQQEQQTQTPTQRPTRAPRASSAPGLAANVGGRPLSLQFPGITQAAAAEAAQARAFASKHVRDRVCGQHARAALRTRAHADDARRTCP